MLLRHTASLLALLLIGVYANADTRFHAEDREDIQTAQVQISTQPAPLLIADDRLHFGPQVNVMAMFGAVGSVAYYFGAQTNLAPRQLAAGDAFPAARQVAPGCARANAAYRRHPSAPIVLAGAAPFSRRRTYAKARFHADGRV